MTVCDAGLSWGAEPSPSLGVGQQLSAKPPPCSPVVCSSPHVVLANRGSQIPCKRSSIRPWGAPVPARAAQALKVTFTTQPVHLLGRQVGKPAKQEFAPASASCFCLFIYFPLHGLIRGKQAETHPTRISWGEATVPPCCGDFRMCPRC